jgi:cold shock CspA family protein
MSGLPSLLGAHEGRVTAFDVERGWGTVTTPGGEELFLHCTAIADGSRTIVVGTAVAFETRAARNGTYEASAITPR